MINESYEAEATIELKYTRSGGIVETFKNAETDRLLKRKSFFGDCEPLEFELKFHAGIFGRCVNIKYLLQNYADDKTN